MGGSRLRDEQQVLHLLGQSLPPLQEKAWGGERLPGNELSALRTFMINGDPNKHLKAYKWKLIW